MLTLNIISPELKDEIKLIATYKNFKTLFFVILIIASIYAITLLLCMLFLQMHYADIYESNIPVKNTVASEKNNIKQANEQMKIIEDIQSKTVLWSYLLERLSAVINNGISISQIQIDKNTDTINITGNAKTRDDLLIFKQKIEEQTYLKDIDFPRKNYTVKTNINFEISAKFASYEFAKF